MTVTDFIAIPIVGVALSLAVEWLKAKYSANAIGVKTITIVASVILGATYYFLQGTAAWQAILGILSTSTLFWAYFVNNGSKNDNQ